MVERHFFGQFRFYRVIGHDFSKKIMDQNQLIDQLFGKKLIFLILHPLSELTHFRLMIELFIPNSNIMSN